MTERTATDAVGHFSGYTKQFHAFYEKRADFAERLTLWHELLDKYLEPGAFAIDMGCGTGVFTFYMAEQAGRVVGIDGASEMVRFCEDQRRDRALTNVRFAQGRLPVVDETGLANADLLISSSVVEYVDDLDGCLGLFSRLLKPGGVMILSMPNLFSISRTYERIKYRLTGEPNIYQHILHFTSPGALRRRVRKLGLELEDAARYYAHYARPARLLRALRFPPPLTEDLFVAVFRKVPRNAVTSKRKIVSPPS